MGLPSPEGPNTEQLTQARRDILTSGNTLAVIGVIVDGIDVSDPSLAAGSITPREDRFGDVRDAVGALREVLRGHQGFRDLADDSNFVAEVAAARNSEVPAGEQAQDA